MRRLITGPAIALAIVTLSAGHSNAEPTTMPRGPHPPPEALDACAKLDDGAACSFSINGDSIDGTCRAPQGKPLACVPKHMPPPPREAIEACAKLDDGAACTVNLDGRSMNGECHGPQGKPLACVPEGMPPPPN